MRARVPPTDTKECFTNSVFPNYFQKWHYPFLERGEGNRRIVCAREARFAPQGRALPLAAGRHAGSNSWDACDWSVSAASCFCRARARSSRLTVLSSTATVIFLCLLRMRYLGIINTYTAAAALVWLPFSATSSSSRHLIVFP